MAGRLQPRRAIDEKDAVVDVISLVEFFEEYPG